MNKIHQYYIVFLLLVFIGCFTMDGYGQSADLIITKTGATQLFHGDSSTYLIIICNNGPNDVTDATFTDTLPTGLTNVQYLGCGAFNGAVCPVPATDISISNTNFSGTIPFLPNGGCDSLLISYNAPTSVTSYSNTASVDVPAGVTEVNPITNESTWNVAINTTIDLESMTSISGSLNCGNIPNDTLTITAFWVNSGPADAGGSIIEYDLIRNRAQSSTGGSATLDYDIVDWAWTRNSGGAVSLPGTTPALSGTIDATNNTFDIDVLDIEPTIASWPSGDTLFLSYKLVPTLVNYSASCGTTFDIRFESISDFLMLPVNYSDPNPGNENDSEFSTTLSCENDLCPIIDISSTTSIGGNLNCGNIPNDTLTITAFWVNAGPADAGGTRIWHELIRNRVQSSTGGSATLNYDLLDWVWSRNSGGSVSVPGTTPALSGTIDATSNTSNIDVFDIRPTIASWPAGDTIFLSYKFVPTSIIYSISCGITFNIRFRSVTNVLSIPAGVTDSSLGNEQTIVNSTNLSCDNGTCPMIDISSSASISGNFDCGNIPNDTLTTTVFWVNAGPEDAGGTRIWHELFRNKVQSSTGGSATLDYDLVDWAWSRNSGGSVSVPGTTPSLSGSIDATNNTSNIEIFDIRPTIASWPTGDTLFLSYKFVPTAINYSASCGIRFNIRFRPISDVLSVPSGVTDVDEGNDRSLTNSNSLEASITDLTISVSVDPAVLDFGDTITFTIEVQNVSSNSSTSDVSWIDTLPASFDMITSSITCSTLIGSATCSGNSVSYDAGDHTISQTISSLPTTSGLLITFKGVINSMDNITESNLTDVLHPCGSDCVPATNTSSTNYQINAVLPIELIQFYGVANDQTGATDLFWRTASELNSSHFEIERSNNSIAYSTIGKVSAAANSIEIIPYIFHDENPLKDEISYYRLKQVDLDGSFEYSSIISVRSVKNNALVIIPSIVNKGEPIKIYGQYMSSYVIFNSLGSIIYRGVKSSDITDSNFIIETHDFESGLYFLVINERQVGKFIIH